MKKALIFTSLLLFISFPGWSRQIMAVRLQGIFQPPGLAAKNAFVTNYVPSVDARPNYFQICPAPGCPGPYPSPCGCALFPNGCCPNYIDFYVFHQISPGTFRFVGCYDRTYPYANSCTSYSSQEPYPEANFPGGGGGV